MSSNLAGLPQRYLHARGCTLRRPFHPDAGPVIQNSVVASSIA
jgi:hypothetical protein